MPIHLTLTLLLVSLGLGLLISRWRRFDGTTLVAPFGWTVFSLFVLAATEGCLVFGNAGSSTIHALRYLSATSTFCPLMAVLGAKRPQNVGWQLIVVTLWIVLILPVGETLLLWRGGSLDEGPARRWLLLILMGVGMSNYALTRFCLAALIVTVGQTLLLLPQLPILASSWSSSFLAGVVCIVSALSLVCWQTRRSASGSGWNAVWNDFRNAFGLVWSLRVMERINSTGKVSGWKNELTWYGFTSLDEQQATENEELNLAMRTTLRRFVSPDWIDSRYSDSTGDQLDSEN